MNDKDLNVISQIFKILFIVIAWGLGGWIMISGPAVTEGKDAIAKFSESLQMNAAIYFMLFILITGGVMVLFFFLFQIIQSPKRTILSIIGIVISSKVVAEVLTMLCIF